MSALAYRLPKLLDWIAAKPYYNLSEAGIITDLQPSQLYYHAKLGHLTIRRGRIERDDLRQFCDNVLVDADDCT
jgi:hypothetical protein